VFIVQNFVMSSFFLELPQIFVYSPKLQNTSKEYKKKARIWRELGRRRRGLRHFI